MKKTILILFLLLTCIFANVKPFSMKTSVQNPIHVQLGFDDDDIPEFINF
ncbi:MAG: hypothetical protein KKE16_07160 [Firmicutes bacterium]|nr:hypothetical protein [Bacillota bacterium]